MVVHDICTASDLHRFSSDNKLIVIDFHADWCRPCKRLRPHFTALSDKYTDRAHFLRSNVETSSDIADRYTVRTLPTVIFITGNGSIMDRVQGLKPVIIQETLEKCLAGGVEPIPSPHSARAQLFKQQNLL
jgi:thioredoxin 1